MSNPFSSVNQGGLFTRSGVLIEKLLHIAAFACKLKTRGSSKARSEQLANSYRWADKYSYLWLSIAGSSADLAHDRHTDRKISCKLYLQGFEF